MGKQVRRCRTCFPKNGVFIFNSFTIFLKPLDFVGALLETAVKATRKTAILIFGLDSKIRIAARKTAILSMGFKAESARPKGTHSRL